MEGGHDPQSEWFEDVPVEHVEVNPDPHPPATSLELKNGWSHQEFEHPANMKAGVRGALAAIGAPIAWAEQWPHGALRFSARFDKRGYESVVPLSRDARNALDVYLRHHPKAGDVPLLPV